MTAAPVIIKKPELFFKERVEQVLGHINLTLDETLEYYLVNLLCDFIDPATNPAINGANPIETPLALMLKEAVEAHKGDKVKKYKQLGDTSLYYAGYFGEFVSSSSVDLGYYVAMGSQAYRSAAGILGNSYGDSHFSEVYSGLSEEFSNLVTVISHVAGTNPNPNAKAIVKLYEKWLDTQSEDIKKLLLDHGIDPEAIDVRKH